MLIKLSLFVILSTFSTAAMAETKACAMLFNGISESESLKNLRVIYTEKGPKSTEEGYILTFEGGLRGFFKPKDLEHESDRDSGYQSPSNEVAAYTVSELFRFNIVPTTIDRTIKDRPGSLQLYVEGKTPKEIFEKTDVFIVESDLIWVFDKLIANIDRSDRNYIITENKTQWAIDNAASFFIMQNRIPIHFKDEEAKEKLRSVIRSNPETIRKLQTLTDREFLDSMKGQLKANQIRQLLERRKSLVEIINEL